MTGTEPRRILALRALGLGDFLTGIPALRALRRRYPDAELTLAAPTALAPLVARSRTADRLIGVGELEPVPWTGQAPDLAVDLHGRGAASHRLLSRLSSPRLIAFADPDGGYPDGPRWRAGEHEVRRWCRLLSEEGIPADPEDLDLDVGAAAERILVLVHPGAAAASRRWGAQNFARVARGLADEGHSVLITAGPGERDLGALVVRAAGLARNALVTGLDLAALTDAVAAARLLVCGDTGVAHLATALHTPSVVLFGPVPPAEWGPPQRPEHIALWHGSSGYRGDPHAPCADPVLRMISPDEVLAAARRQLAAFAP